MDSWKPIIPEQHKSRHAETVGDEVFFRGKKVGKVKNVFQKGRQLFTGGGTAPDKAHGKKPKYRHELKYLISEGEHVALKSRMSPVLSLDPHAGDGGYMIRSLYFDDIWDSSYNEKDMGIFARKKYRIRIYNCSDRHIRLERKTKQGSYIYKESAKLTRDEVERILDGDYDFLLKSDQQLCREFYVECVCNVMRPRVIVDYDREPFIMDAGTVRITFDMAVRAAVLSDDIFDPQLPTLDCLEPGKLVLEVKYTELLPKIVQELIPTQAADMTAVSKYVLCCDKTMYMRDETYWYENVNKWDLRGGLYS